MNGVLTPRVVLPVSFFRWKASIPLSRYVCVGDLGWLVL